MNAGLLLMKSLTPVVSTALLFALILFAMGFALTLVSTLKIQWGHKVDDTEYVISGVSMLVIALIIIIIV